jgi:hypothetical protein
MAPVKEDLEPGLLLVWGMPGVLKLKRKHRHPISLGWFLVSSLLVRRLNDSRADLDVV